MTELAGRLARVSARVAPGETGEVVVDLGNRTDTFLAHAGEGEVFEVGATVVVVHRVGGKHVLVTAFS